MEILIMKKLILSLLIGLLASSIPATAMDKNTQPQQQTKSYFWSFTNFIPKKLWPTAWWKDYLCTHRIFARQWHAEKAAKKVEKVQNKLNKELNTSTPNPKFINFSESCIENAKKDCNCKKLPDKLELMLKEHLKQLGYSDIPDIVEDPAFQDKSNMCYIYELDQIGIAPCIRKLFENGLEKEYVNEFKASAAHEMGHREKLHGKIRDYYQARAEKTNQQVLNKLCKAQENEADVLGCLKLGPHLCHLMRDGFKQRTSFANNSKITVPSNEDFDGGNTHPPTKKRIKKIKHNHSRHGRRRQRSLF